VVKAVNMNNTNVESTEYTKVLFLFAFDGRLFFQADNGLIVAVPVTEIATRTLAKEIPAVLVEPWIGNAMRTLQQICREVGKTN
jgi:hypothetical protein